MIKHMAFITIGLLTAQALLIIAWLNGFNV
jgi:hypothetical protein